MQHAVIHEECTFQPNVHRSMTVNNLNDNSLISGGRSKNVGPSSKAVTKRLYGQAVQQKERLIRLKKEKNWGEMNKECTFEPNADKRSKSHRRSKSVSGKTRSMVLYENAFRLEDRRKKVQEDEEARIKQETRGETSIRNQKSDALIQKRKERILGTIFDALDSDMDNSISFDKIEIEAISKDVARVIYPIISELEDLDDGIGSIDRQEFVAASMRLYQVRMCNQQVQFSLFHIHCKFCLDSKRYRSQHNLDVPTTKKVQPCT